MPGWTAAFAIASITFLGALLAGLLPRCLSPGKRLSRFVPGVAAGILLASALGLVLPEGFAIVFDASYPPFVLPIGLISGLAVLGGFLFMLGLESGGMGHEPTEEQHSLYPLALGLGIHELTDGLALGASLAAGSLILTLPILAAVLAHRIPVAFSLGVFLWRPEEKSSHPLRALVGFSLATPLGLLITFLLLQRLSHLWVGLWLLFSGGTFLYVAAVDVLGRVRRQQAGIGLFLQVGLGVALLSAFLILIQALGFRDELH